MSTNSYTIKIVTFPEDDVFIAQCLNPDIAVQGKTKDAALYRLFRSIASNMSLATKRNVEPFSNFGKAPQYYVDLFEKAEAVI